MNYPTISDYKEAVRNTEKYFTTLHNLSVAEDKEGTPVMHVGNDSVIFKMRDKDTGQYYAVKCFLQDDEYRDSRYRDITNEMQFARTGYFVHTRYLENEITLHYPNGEEISCPVVVMNWTEGIRLDKYLELYIGNEYPMRMITAQFCSFASWLLTQNLVHGNISADNILVCDDFSIVVIDYDKMALRTKCNDINDDLSLVSLALSLKAITLCPKLYERYVTDCSLLFKNEDYEEPFYSKVLKEIHNIDGDDELKQLLGLFYMVLAKGNLNGISPQLLRINCPEIKYESLCDLICSEYDDEDSIEDDYGVRYTADGKSLIDVPCRELGEYKIKEGTRKICSCAFQQCSSLVKVEIPYTVKVIEANPFCDTSLKYLVCSSPNYVVEGDFLLTEDRQYLVSYFGNRPSVTIPSSVRIIGEKAFAFCKTITEVIMPASVKEIADNAFWMCTSLLNVSISPSVTYIGSCAFSGCPFYKIYIPDSVRKIKSSAFASCSNLTDVIMPSAIKVIEESLFSDCVNLNKITLPSCVEIIEEGAFFNCSTLTDVVMPDSVKTIKGRAFSNCEALRSVEIPCSVNNIEANPFSNTGLKEIICNSPYYVFENKALFTKDRSTLVSYIGNERKYVVPSSVTVIGNGAFEKCYTLYIMVPSSVVRIEDNAFYECPYLRKVELPSTLKQLGEDVFHGCELLESVNIPSCASEIPIGAFSLCSSLLNINIPSSVTDIYSFAFSDCMALECVDIPSSVTQISEYAFASCSSLSRVIIRSPFMDLQESTFEDCESLSEIFVPRGRGEYYRQLFAETGNECFVKIITEG